MKQPLHELMGWPGPMTNRQHRTWLRWLEDDFDTPDLTDFYLMQLAQFIHAANSKKKVPGLQEYRIKFKVKEKPKVTREQAANLAKARWLPHFGDNLKIVPKT